MAQAEQITDHLHNELAERYPFKFGFDKVPDFCPPDLAPYLFDQLPDTFPPTLEIALESDYTLEDELRLKDYLILKGFRFREDHGNYSEYQDKYERSKFVVSSALVRKKVREFRAKKNYQARKKAGAVRPGALGIVGNNLDTCQTNSLQKETRAGLFRAQNMVQKVRLPDESGEMKPIVSKNVCNCGKPLGEQIELNRNNEHGSSSLGGIQTCGSVWACPVCRNRIISRRAEELKEIFQKWTARDGEMFMITLTVPHKKADNLTELYGSNAMNTGLSGALGKFRQSRDFSKIFKDRVNYFGDIRGIEVTWGRKNGFHPHIHILVLTEHCFDFKEWKHRFHKVWSRACLDAGLREPSWEHGVVISKCNTSTEAIYLAKWSAASEIVSQGMKIAKQGNYSISELERCLWDKSYRDTRQLSMKKAASVLRAYYGAMKGQRMLQMGGISPGENWKKELLELTDEDEIETETHERICWIDNSEYIKIKRAGKLPGLLHASERGSTAPQRIENVKFWLQKNGYSPDAVQHPYANEPPPLAFSYSTGFEDQFFKQQKGYA